MQITSICIFQYYSTYSVYTQLSCNMTLRKQMVFLEMYMHKITRSIVYDSTFPISMPISQFQYSSSVDIMMSVFMSSLLYRHV